MIFLFCIFEGPGLTGSDFVLFLLLLSLYLFFNTLL